MGVCALLPCFCDDLDRLLIALPGNDVKPQQRTECSQRVERAWIYETLITVALG